MAALVGPFQLGCEGPLSSLEVKGARAFRAADGSVVVDVDLLASEALGGNIGVYCTRASFVGLPSGEDFVEVCHADLRDGDSRTVRLVSGFDVEEGTAIHVRVRLGAVDIGRSLAAPPR